MERIRLMPRRWPMTDRVHGRDRRPGRHSKGLLIAASVFGLLYLIFITLSFIPSQDGSPISTTVPFKPFDLEQICVKSLFLLFLAGYVLAWRNEALGGIAFILWFVAMCAVELLIIAPLKPKEGGGGIPMGVPLLALGILFVVRSYRGRTAENARIAP
jgi:hypothetical protein